MTNDLNTNSSNINASSSNENQGDTDPDLARYFAQMRDQDKACAPPFPSEAALKSRKPVSGKRSIQKLFSFEYLPQMAASFAVIALLSVLLTSQPEEDPAEIYASIMDNQQTMMTDHLLVVSGSLFPAMTEAPSLYDTNTEFETELYAN